MLISEESNHLIFVYFKQKEYNYSIISFARTSMPAHLSDHNLQENCTSISQGMCCIVPYRGKFRGRKLSGLWQFCGYSQKFSPQNLGVWHLWCCKSKQSAYVSCYTVYLACLSVVTKYVSYDTSFC